MIKTLRFLILGLCILTGFTSCVSSFKDLRITGIEKPNLTKLMDTQGDLALNMEIQNPGPRDLTIKTLELQVLNNKKNILVSINLKEAVTILKAQTQYYRIPLDLNIQDPIGCFLTYNNVRKGNDTFLIEGSAKVKSGWLSKTIKFNRSIGKEINQLIQFK